MPQKNVVKDYQNNAFFHIYNHFIENLNLFSEDQHCQKFLNLVDRYLGPRQHTDENGMAYKKVSDKVDLVAFCLMPTHYHLLLYQKEDKGITELMHKLTTSFSLYVNLNNPNRRGTIYESTFKASAINDQNYLWHVSRYIHLNPTGTGVDYRDYQWSSYVDYVNAPRYTWLKRELILDSFDGHSAEYARFVEEKEVEPLEVEPLGK
jgi:putative transposase